MEMADKGLIDRFYFLILFNHKKPPSMKVVMVK
jgi:hypothetical protein